MEILLNQCKWKVKGYWPYVPMLGNSVEVGNELMGVTHWIDATVPGGVHYDLLREGLIEDPYYEQNSLKCEWVEHRWWSYKTSFLVDKAHEGKNLQLVFKGVDYKAHFYLNREKLGEHEGMYEHVVFDVSGRLNFDSENELTVLFESAPQEMSQIGHTSMTKTQKSRFNYKWDFSTRMVNIGFWDDIVLKVTGAIALKDPSVTTDVENGTGIIRIASGIEGIPGDSYFVSIQVEYDGKSICTHKEKLNMDSNEMNVNKIFQVQNPKLWYPNGTGEQPLYHVHISISDGSGISDEKSFLIGIRKLEYAQNEDSPAEALPYTFVVNGKPVYIKGVNLTPFDHLYGNVSLDTYDKYIQLLKYANINMVRIWGGGIIEKEYFYDLCDKNGIMVWQEFIQSSSGIDNIPSVDPHFLELLKKTAIQAIKNKRSHVCHTVWSGGNELMDVGKVPVGYDHPNIRMLKDIVEELDPRKLFLPSSSSGPNDYMNIDRPGENHDVHGGWKYEGIERQYHIFNHSDSLFHSEFGVDGCSSLSGLKKFLGEDNLKITDMKQNLVWRHHGEWWDTYDRDKEIFGELSSLAQFIKVSQFIQAEGLRYALEANRRRKFRNSGSIVWQFNEPWPNVSCTCLVEHCGKPKMVYYWLKQAYAPVSASLVYNGLRQVPEQAFEAKVFVHNSISDQMLKVKWEILDITGRVFKSETWQGTAISDSAKQIGEIHILIPKQQDGIFFVRLRVYDSADTMVCENLYTFSQLETSIFEPLIHIEGGEMKVNESEEGYKICNIGDKVCLFVHGEVDGLEESTIIENNFTSIFPGEEKIFKVFDKRNGLNQVEATSDLKIVWKHLNSTED